MTEIGQSYQIPIRRYLPFAAEAMLLGTVPAVIPVRICTGGGLALQEYSTEGLIEFRSFMAVATAQEARDSLRLLCADAAADSRLTGEALALFTEDRIFWDPSRGAWRYLLLASETERWSSLESRTPEALWTALLMSALDAAVEAKDYLQRVFDEMESGIVSAEVLDSALEAVSLIREPEPPDTEEDMEEDDTEYRPWEHVKAKAAPSGQERRAETIAPFSSASGWSASELKPILRQKASSQAGRPEHASATQRRSRTILLEINGISSELRTADEAEAPVAAGRIPKLVRSGTGESAPLDRPKFFIGSNSDMVNFTVRNNNTVSRRHACILSQQGSYFIVDLDSRNGVYKDGKRLLSNHAAELKIGETFLLSNEEFSLQW